MLDRQIADTSRPVRRWLWLAAPWLGLVLLKLWLVGGQLLTAYGSLTIDDKWFVERASWISAGEWFGPFDARTLIKQPGYPIFIAAVHALRVPLLVAHQLVYIFAIAVVLVALRRVLQSRQRRLLAFAILLFNPMTMNSPISVRVDRAGIYPAATLVLFGCLIGLVSSCDRPRRPTVAWGAGASVSLVVLWSIREEWLLVVPAVVFALLSAIVRITRATMHPGTRALAIAAVAVIPVSVPLGTLWLEHVNQARYGLAVTNIQQTSMSAGLGPMLRVDPVTSFEQFPVTLETRQLIYQVSPHFAALRETIEADGNVRYRSTRPDGVADLGGQVFMWVVLDAVGATGSAASASEVDAAFRSIGREIDAACADGRLRCAEPHAGIAPAWHWGRLPGLVARTFTGLRKTFGLSAFSALSPVGDGTTADRALFSRMTSEPLAPSASGFSTRQRVHLINAVRWLYRLFTIAAVTVFVVKASSAWRERRTPSWDLFSIVTIGVLLLVGRVVGLAYLDLTLFPAFSPTYLASGYAVALVVAVAVTLGDRSRHMRRRCIDQPRTVPGSP